jgi:hypothetical protein
MNVDEFVSVLEKSEKLSSQQISNLNKIQQISAKFHNDAGLKPPKQNKIGKDTVVLESGHQPNFLPYAGVWKKVFMLDFLKKKLKEKGKRCVAVFGFADYNLASAHLLYKNKVPALSRTGFQKIGFQTPKDKWRVFNSIPKPSREQFEKELENIQNFYMNSARSVKYPEEKVAKNLQVFQDIMRKSYEKAKNFPDMNAFFIARICSEFGFGVNFFRYTDMQREHLFIDEWNKILENLKEFNEIYNGSLRGSDVDLNYEENSLPFWYHCGCGGIVDLTVQSYEPVKVSGDCQSCNKSHEFSLDRKELEKRFPSMSMNAVSRNIILAEGLGDALYISGAGGGLQYGMISDKISKSLKFRKPVTMAWRGCDYQVGIGHFSFVRDFVKSLKRLAGSEKDKKSLFTARNEHGNLTSKIRNAATALSLKPSILDIFTIHGLDNEISHAWKRSFTTVDITQENGFYIARKDTIHDIPGEFGFVKKGQIVPLYENMVSLDKYREDKKEGG